MTGGIFSSKLVIQSRQNERIREMYCESMRHGITPTTYTWDCQSSTTTGLFPELFATEPVLERSNLPVKTEASRHLPIDDQNRAVRLHQLWQRGKWLHLRVSRPSWGHDALNRISQNRKPMSESKYCYRHGRPTTTTLVRWISWCSMLNCEVLEQFHPSQFPCMPS